MTCRVLIFPDRRARRPLSLIAAATAPAGPADDPSFSGESAAEGSGAPQDRPGAPLSIADVCWRLGAFAAVAWTVQLLLELLAALLRAPVAGW